MKQVLRLKYQLLLVFLLLGIVFIPFSFRNWSIQSEITQYIFGDFILLFGSCFKSIQIVNPEITSDSTTLYILVFLLFSLSTILLFIVYRIGFWKERKEKILNLIQLILVYYLALILLKYGFDKIFKAQFYLPEPNTLYTPLGNLDKDILFWSTMGTSRAYNVFMGILEVIPALMLLYKKTRILGLIILMGVLVNVVLVNFSFDISVKLYSLFLLLMTGLLLAPYVKRFFTFLVLQQTSIISVFSGKYIFKSKGLRYVMKGVVVLFIITETLVPYIQSGNYNDDIAQRNYLHGAYEVTSTKSHNVNNIKRFFVHRQDYFILQYNDDSMEDFHLKIDSTLNHFILTNYDEKSIVIDYNYNENSKELSLLSKELGWEIQSTTIPWKELPLMQPLFHWTVDEY